MQKVMVMLLLSCFVTSVFGQAKEKNTGILRSSHEIKANIFNAIAFKAVDVNYE